MNTAERMILDDARDALVMLELAAGSLELGARATLSPITLATLGLPASDMRDIARELRADAERRTMEARVLGAFAERRAQLGGDWPELAAEVEHITLWYHRGMRIEREDMNGRYLVDFCPDYVPSLEQRSRAVQNPGQAWEC